MRSANSDDFVNMLLSRLERVQADSSWAHQASGVRGSLIKALENPEESTVDGERSLRQLTDAAFQILLHAAREQSRQESSANIAGPVPGRASVQTNK